MKWNSRKNRKSTHQVLLLGILFLLITFQVFITTLTQSQSDYYGIEFGTETEAGVDRINDIWKLEKNRYTYIANNQTKAEVDLLGLNVTRNANQLVWSYDYDTFIGKSINMIFNYNYNYTFNISLSNLINISYSFETNHTFTSSALSFYNWTDKVFYNESVIENITRRLLNISFYSNQKILLNINAIDQTNFTWWFNVTYEFFYKANQVITVRFASLAPGNATLIDNVKTWIFLDGNGDNQLDYMIHWIYGNGVNLYKISNESFTLNGYWNGQWEEVWNGINWNNETGGPRGGFSILTTDRLNITIPDYIVNLTSTVRYAMWSLKIEPNYDWWDALPDDPYWQLAQAIPSFQWGILGISILIVGVIFLIKKKNSFWKKKMV
ncbi:MAG: hypothetical protein ACFFD2_02450 [Promethearchaeota archaeon]